MPLCTPYGGGAKWGFYLRIKNIIVGDEQHHSSLYFTLRLGFSFAWQLTRIKLRALDAKSQFTQSAATPSC
jgi:hypothetical protein